MSKSDANRSNSARKSSSLLSSLFGASNATGGEEKIEYLEDDVVFEEYDDPAGSESPVADEPAYPEAEVLSNDDDGPAFREGIDRSAARAAGSKLREVSTADSVHEIAIPHDDDEVYTTGFSDVANARLWRRTKEARRRAKEAQRSYRDVFTPTRPKRKTEEFLGRRALIGSVIEAIEEECAHMVVCGETGLGKTSLANVVTQSAKNSGYLVVRITGTEDLTFSNLIRTVFEDMFEQIEETPSGDVLWERLGVNNLGELLQDSSLDIVSEFLGEDSLSVNRVIRALSKLSDNQAIVIIDDYDQIKSRELKTKLAQVMKALSDQGGWLSFVIMGRGDSPSELLQDDIETLPNVVGLYLDPLAMFEIEEVILEGSRRISLAFSEDTVQAVARLSQGVPNVVQWLCFLAARRAVRRQGDMVGMEDLAGIVSDVVSKLDAKLRNQYDEVCRFDKGRDNADLLYLAVRAPCTQSGLFSAQSMAVLSKQIVSRSWKESELHTALLPLCGKGRGAVLRKLDTSEGIFYRFAHPTMRSVVMLKKIVRIPLLSDSRTKDVDETYLPPPEEVEEDAEFEPQTAESFETPAQETPAEEAVTQEPSMTIEAEGAEAVSVPENAVRDDAVFIEPDREEAVAPQQAPAEPDTTHAEIFVDVEPARDPSEDETTQKS